MPAAYVQDLVLIPFKEKYSFFCFQNVIKLNLYGKENKLNIWL